MNGKLQGWFGCDLDGTLAHYDGWRGHQHIGAPVAPMLQRIKDHLRCGHDVRIFTARVCELDPARRREVITQIENWCLTHLGQVLPVTNVKDFGMIWCYDDRARQVRENEGTIVGDGCTC